MDLRHKQFCAYDLHDNRGYGDAALSGEPSEGQCLLLGED